MEYAVPQPDPETERLIQRDLESATLDFVEAKRSHERAAQMQLKRAA
jgi:hypothetical protein